MSAVISRRPSTASGGSACPDSQRYSLRATLHLTGDADLIEGIVEERDRHKLEHEADALRMAVGVVRAVDSCPSRAYANGIATGRLTREIAERRSQYPPREPQISWAGSREVGAQIDERLSKFATRRYEQCVPRSRGENWKQILREGLRLLDEGGRQVDEYLRGHYAAMELGADSHEEQAGVYRDHTGEECFWLDFDSYSRDLEQERQDKARQEVKQKEVARKAQAAAASSRAITRLPTAGTRAPRSAAVSRRSQSASTGETRAGPDSDGDDDPPPPSRTGSGSGSGAVS